MPPRFCQSCGAEIPDNITGTCPKCGNLPGVTPDKTKSPSGAAFLSLVITGLGQAYCGALLKSIGVLLAFTLCLSLFAVLDMGIGFYLFFMIWVIGIADAYRTATQIISGSTPWKKSTMLPFGILVIIVGILFVFAFMISAIAMVFAPISCAPGVGCLAPLKGDAQCSDAEGCIRDGTRYMRVSYYDDAGEFFQKALVYDSHNATVFALMGVMAEQRGNQTGAIALFDRSLALDPNQSAVWNNRGVVAARMGDTSAAGAGFENAVNANPNESVAWYNLGTWLLASGDDTAAVAALDRAIALSPENMEFLLKKGRTLNAIGDYSGAVNVFGTVTNVSNEYVPALQGKGEALAALGRYDESCAAFDAAIGVHWETPDLWSAAYNSTTGMYSPAKLWQSPESSSWREILQERLAGDNDDLKKDPGSEYVLVDKGIVLTELQHYDEAIATFNAANSIGNGSAKALNGKGMAEFFKGDNKAALDSFSLASAKDPSFIPSWNNRAFVLWREGQNADAVKAYRHAVQLDSKQQSRKYNYTLIVAFDGRKL